MNFAILINWGNGFKVKAIGKTQEELGEIDNVNNWVVKGIRLQLYELIGPNELNDFEILQTPKRGLTCV